MRRLIITTLVLAFAAALPITACSGTQEYALVGTARAAGADGSIQVETVEGGNRQVTIEIEHLPPPDRIGSGNTMYVVWFQPDTHPPIKASNLAYDPDTRVGTATATTPYPRFTIKITAERNAMSAAPSDLVVAQQRVGGTQD